MTTGKWLTASILCLVAASAHAHAHLTDSDPREGSTIKAPAQLVLTFSEAARLTAVTLQKEGAEAHKLTPPTLMAVRLAIPLPALAAGRYTVSWRVVANDGHVTSGALHFSVVGGLAAADTRATHRRI
jgi:methionine-rich copper-binding protein CopC